VQFPHSFEAIGLPREEESVYRLLLDRPKRSLADISEKTKLSRRKLQEALLSLESKGFLTRVPGTRSRYLPTPPEIAVEPRVLQRQEDLELIRKSAAELGEIYRRQVMGSDPAELVEIIRGREAVGRRFDQLQQAAKTDVLIIDRPPYANPDPRNETELLLLRRGVVVRTIYASASIETPGYMNWVEELIENGEQARLLTDVPAKLAIIDRKAGLLPLNFEEPGIEGAAVIQRSSLLDLLIAFFELVWERAAPLPNRSPTRDEATPRASDMHRDSVLALMAAGMKDASIARALGVSKSTVDRRVRRLMEALGAKTRFQAGLRAAALTKGKKSIESPRLE
jgi:sugar-specific transcriptional regulator TrmB